MFGGPQGSPRTDRLIEASIQWAEIMRKIDNAFSGQEGLKVKPNSKSRVLKRLGRDRGIPAPVGPCGATLAERGDTGHSRRPVCLCIFGGFDCVGWHGTRPKRVDSHCQRRRGVAWRAETGPFVCPRPTEKVEIVLGDSGRAMKESFQGLALPAAGVGIRPRRIREFDPPDRTSLV